MQEREKISERAPENVSTERMVARLQAKLAVYEEQLGDARHQHDEFRRQGAVDPAEERLLRETVAMIRGKMTAMLEAVAIVTAGTAPQEPAGPPISVPDSEARATAPEEPADAPSGLQERPKTAEKERVSFSGRVAHPPRFEITRKNHVHKLSFSVAEHPDPDTTVYRQVYAFRKVADTWRGNLAKGDTVSVIAYVSQREGRARDGTPKTFVDYNAVAIRKR